MNLASLIEFGDSIIDHDTMDKAGGFITKELRARYALSILDLESMKKANSNLKYNKSLDIVLNKYKSANAQFLSRSFNLTEFVEMCQHVLQDQNRTTFLIADSMSGLILSDCLNHHLDGFFKRRVGISTLLSHFLSLNAQFGMSTHTKLNAVNNKRLYVGIVNLSTILSDVIESAAVDASSACSRAISKCPKVVVECPKIQIPSIPYHLQYVMTELLKNAMVATVEEARRSATPEILSNIKVSVSDNCDVITLRIIDKGCGLGTEEEQDNLWKFAFSSSHSSLKNLQKRKGLTGFGIGLPLAKIYCQYLGYTLSLESNHDGLGSTASIVLNKNLCGYEEPGCKIDSIGNIEDFSSYSML